MSIPNEQPRSHHRHSQTGSHRQSESHRSHRRRHSRHGQSASSPEPVAPLSIWCRLVDLCLLTALLAVPFFFGGKHPYGEVVLLVSAAVAAVAWTCHLLTQPQVTWHRTRVEPLLLAIAGVCLLQIVPLPDAVLRNLSPGIARLLPFWYAPETTGFVNGPWTTLSLTPFASRGALTLCLGYLTLFVVCLQRIQTRQDVRRLMNQIAIAGVVMSVLALAQYLLSNGKFLWIIEHPEGTTVDRPKGMFFNKNHFAQFAALSIGPLVACLLSHLSQRTQEAEPHFGSNQRAGLPPQVVTGLLASGLAVVLIGILMSQSRGGVLAACTGSLILLTVLYRRSLITLRVIGAVAGTGMIAVTLLLLVEHGQLQRAVSRLDNWSDNGRMPIWKANLAAISEFPVTGTGLGSHRYIYPRYLDAPFQEGEYTYAESSLLQIGTESGLLGFSLAILSLIVCCYWCSRGLRIARSSEAILLLAAATSGLIISAVHAVFDFVWHIPGCLVPLLLMMAAACRLYQLERASHSAETYSFTWHLPKPVLAGGLLLFLPVCVWSSQELMPVLNAWPHWSSYRHIALSEITGRGDTVSADDSIPADQKAVIRFRRRLQELRQAVRRNNRDPRSQMRLAVHYANLFHVLQQRSENAMPLNQLRDAALASEFESPQEQREWLERATGGNIKYAFAALHHARRAVQLNPLEARAWLHLTELAFLDGGPADLSERILEQSLTLRPYDAQVLFVAGRDAYLRGNPQRWLELWKQAFHRDVSVQRQIISQLSVFTETPVELLVQNFDPDLAALERMAEIIRRSDLPGQKEHALTMFSSALIKRAEAKDNINRSMDWLKAAGVFAELNDAGQARHCYEKALASSPSNFVVRIEFAAWLIKHDERAAALQHLQWCERLQPDHPRLHRLMAQAAALPVQTQTQNKVQRVSGTTRDRAY